MTTVTRIWQEGDEIKAEQIPEFLLYQAPHTPQGSTHDAHRRNFVRYTRRFCRLWCEANGRQFNANWRYFV